MKIAILGFGTEGRSALDYWKLSANQITICDQDKSIDIPPGVDSRLGPDYLSGLNDFDLIVRTPGLHPSEIVKANNPEILSKVTTLTNEFFRVCPTKNIVGVTGTKGKGTTSTLIAKLLEASGHKVYLGGNIGNTAVDLLQNQIQPQDWVVFELSSFQLIDLKYSPKIAVCLMIAPEHLNWHLDFDEYLDSKSNIFTNQTSEDIAIYFDKNPYSKEIADKSPGHKIAYFAKPGAYVEDNHFVIDDKVICGTSEVRLLGKHNWENICAAITAVWQVSKEVELIRAVVTTFSGLEHRLEFVRELGNVQYYDDSFGTTPETAIVAIEAFSQPIVIILGGSDKQAKYEELAKTVKNHDVTAVVTIGDTGPAIASSLKDVGYESVYEGGMTIDEIIDKARSLAQPGSVVLLSTGCASFGLFKDYKDRGEQFKKAVLGLG